MRFTLITEGVSENRIIKFIISKFFQDDNLFFRDAQPQIINNRQDTVGGWNEVLKYCGRTDDLVEIFNNTDYLVIQIDTDQSQTKPFSISHTKIDNTAKRVDELYSDVINKLKSLIDHKILEIYNDKIIFAISIHSIECWLLPLYYTNNHKSDVRNCLSTLNVGLRRRNLPTIPPKDKNSSMSVRAYEKALKDWRRKQDILKSAEHNSSFKIFLNSLANIKV